MYMVLLLCLFVTPFLRAQTLPVVEARGVINGVSFELAPSTVAPGGILNIYGFNMAAGTTAASAVPLPTSLGTPPVEVTVNGRPAPLYFVSATQINAQVPWETESGTAQVVVRRGGAASRPATISVRAEAPSLFALNGAGFGPAIAVRAENGRLAGRDNLPAGGEVVILYASGLGPVEPGVANGAAGPSDPLARVARPQRAWVSGLPARVLFAGLAPGFVGLFQINLQLPERAAPGDVLQYSSGPQAANLLTLGSLDSPRVRSLSLPEGQLASITDADLNGGFVAVNGPRGDDGCYQNAYVLDFRRNRSVRIAECLIHSNANAPSPFIAENSTSRLAALVGPAAGTPPAGISSRVLIVDGARGETTTVELPAPASLLSAAGAGVRGLTALLPGDSPQVAIINTDTGEVQVRPAGALQGGAGRGVETVAPVDGLAHVVSTPVALPGNRVGVVLADSDSAPQRALFVVLSGGEPAARIAFPAGYLPLIPPRGEAGPRPGPGPTPGPGAPAPRASATGDLQPGRVLVLSRSADGSKHALVLFDVEAGSARALDFPSGVYAAACSPEIRLIPLSLGRKIALPSSDRLETAAANPCAATGLLLYDLAASTLNRLALPENSTLEVATVRMLNDYLFGTNADRLSQQNAASVFVYDAASDTIRKLDTPRGATAFTSLQPVPATGQLLAMASNRTPGDEGLILFDLASGNARFFPLPDGFARIANAALHTATRKITARGIKAGTEGSQVLVFDPATGLARALPNPEGVQSVGAPAAAGAQARLTWIRNQNSNSVLAAGFSSSDRPVALVLFEGF